MRAGTALALLLLAAMPGAPARAALPDEIQVYVDDLNDPGIAGLQLHINTTPKGEATPDYARESIAAQGVRLTPEFAYGLTPDLEAGLYLPVVHEASGTFRAPGVKLRLKWVPVRPAAQQAGLFAGLNGELSQVQYRFDDDRRTFELRPILGWHNDDWLLAANPVLEFALLGGHGFASPSFAPSFKVARTVATGVALGIEYYADLGTLAHTDSWAAQRHTLYGAIDIDRKPWNVNFGIGRGLTPSTDAWTVKLIIAIPFGE